LRISESESKCNIFFFIFFIIILIFFVIASRPLNNLAENQLESLLIEGGLLEIYVDQIKLLTKLVNSSRRSNVSSDVCLDIFEKIIFYYYY